VGDVVFVWSIFRIFSRNIPKRREENNKFMRKAQPVLKWLRLQQTMRKDKEHRYFKCPNCSQYLRVPKGKGKITVTCRSCKASFQEKS
jgi:transcription elongation factor Elf1